MAASRYGIQPVGSGPGGGSLRGGRGKHRLLSSGFSRAADLQHHDRLCRARHTGRKGADRGAADAEHELHHRAAVGGEPEQLRHVAGDRRNALPDGHRHRAGDSDRRRRRPLPRGVRGPGAAHQPLDRGQHPEPRRRALDRVRHPRTCIHRQRIAQPRLHVADGRPHPDPAGAADRDHCGTRSGSSVRTRSAKAPLALGATKWQTIAQAGAAGGAVPGIALGSILALSRAIGESAPLLLLGAATFTRFTPTGVDSQLTALPLQIFDYIKRPQEEFRSRSLPQALSCYWRCC